VRFSLFCGKLLEAIPPYSTGSPSDVLTRSVYRMPTPELFGCCSKISCA
jgi:hypothetical protein